MLFSAFLLLLAISRIHAAVIKKLPNDLPHENDVYDRPLPASWYQPEDHPVHYLFKRAPGDGVSYPAVGSPGQSAYLPPVLPSSLNCLPSVVLELPSLWIYTEYGAARMDGSPQCCSCCRENPKYSKFPLSTRSRSQWSSSMLCCRVL